MACLALASAGSAPGAEPLSEAELVARFLEAPVVVAELRAAQARVRADGTAVSLLESPTLEARHEEARGPAGATTDAVGGAVTLDLGLSPLGRTRAARLRGSAGEHRRRALALDAVCMFRTDVVDLWAANRAAGVSQSSHERLEQLLETLEALAEAGESSGYDRDRTTLAVMAHWTSTAAQLGAVEHLRAAVSALVGGEAVADVALAAVPPLPEVDAAIGRVSAHPEILALELESAASEAASAAAWLGQLPDLTISGGGRWDAPPNGGPATPGFEVGGAVQIPWTDGGRADARQRTADHARAEAFLVRTTAQLEAAVRGAHRRVEVFESEVAASVEPERVWNAAMERYTAGESSLDDLLQVAAAVEAARLAGVERERLHRHARLELSCATGQLAEPTLQSVLEEAVR